MKRRMFFYLSGVNWGLYWRSFSDGQWIMYIGRLGIGWSNNSADAKLNWRGVPK